MLLYYIILIPLQVTMGTNFFGTLQLCDTLFPLLRPNARVVTASGMINRSLMTSMELFTIQCIPFASFLFIVFISVYRHQVVTIALSSGTYIRKAVYETSYVTFYWIVNSPIRSFSTNDIWIGSFLLQGIYNSTKATFWPVSKY